MSQKNIIGISCVAIIVIFFSIYRSGDEKAQTPPLPLPMFPTEKEPHEESMQALLMGKLELIGRCLKVGENLIIWPHGFTMDSKDSLIKIYDDKHRLVAQVGDSIKLGGGQVNTSKFLEAQLTGYTPGICRGPLWMVGDVVK
jgi:hypothetical protein